MKISFTKKTCLLAMGAILAISACKNSPYPGYEMSENGLYSKFYTHDEKGVKPKEGDVVRIIMSWKNSKDSVLFDSKKANPNGTNYIEFPLQKSTFKGSFEDALYSMSVGDSASFIISADSVYLKTFQAKQLPPYITKGTMLTFETKLLKVTAKAEVEAERNKKMEEQKKMMEERKNAEPQELAKYLADNKITTKPTASGLYYIEKVKGKGAKPAKGNTVKVNYTGRFLNGKVFDTSDEATAKEAGLYNAQRPYGPIELPIGVGKVIPGWDEGIMLMSTGAKGQLIIPSALGYGQGGGEMPPFSPLVFDVELVSFSATPPAPENGMKEQDVKH
ncbi:MAG: FKBP-type peptidyl-prolyl cis-trans isomerase [Bacteroidia bacterium]